mmetsp:Transcript_76377/g.192258  ORF Transcript_76377/g.192258 Transcript_76377/m.192258 type:complete len:86 (-) Transcript_76377:374-631(-)
MFLAASGGSSMWKDDGDSFDVDLDIDPSNPYDVDAVFDVDPDVEPSSASARLTSMRRPMGSLVLCSNSVATFDWVGCLPAAGFWT